MRANPALAKQAAILSSARSLFLRHGIRRVSVEQVCRDARVSKRTFYKRFSNRDALAIRVIGELIEESTSRLEAILSADIAIEKKVREIIAAKSGLAAETSTEFYNELMTADSESGRFARRKQGEWDKRVRAFYAEAQARGEIRADLNVDLLMFMLVRARDITKDPELQRIQPDLSILAESIMKVFFYGILPRPDRAAASARGKVGRHD
jgi:AcrR family transcriptional regulator